MLIAAGRKRRVCTSWCWHSSQAQNVGLFEGSTGNEKRGDLRAGLSLALERHETLRFSGFAADKLEFSVVFFFKV